MNFKNAFVLALALGFTAAGADTIKNTERGVTVKYKGGVTEKYVVVYNGIVTVAKEERGGPAIPARSWLEDRPLQTAQQQHKKRRAEQGRLPVL